MDWMNNFVFLLLLFSSTLGYINGILTLEESLSSNADSSEEVDTFSNPKSQSHRLEIWSGPPGGYLALVKRINETLNLTCVVVKESGPFVNFQLEWYLPQHINNRIQKQKIKSAGVNSLQLTINKLQETDSGKYKCIGRSEKFKTLSHSIEINILPRKGFCGDGMFVCLSKSNQCIAQRYLCDGLADCDDGADESKEVCGDSPCDGKLHCDDGRCILKKYCCDKYHDVNCSATYEIPCCSKLNYLLPDFPVQTHHQYREIGFLQSTMYTIIGCAVAFVLIVTFTVIAVCRVHVRRSTLANAYAAYRSDARVWSDLDSYLAASNGRWSRGLLRSDISRSPGLVLNSFGVNDPSANTLLVTYNINNGVQLMGQPMEPPPYEEVAQQRSRDEPPPPYVSRENLHTAAGTCNNDSGLWANRSPPPATPAPASHHAPFLSAIFSLLVNHSQTPPSPPAATERAVVEEDNNNGDINGNNTGQVWVRPNSNRDVETDERPSTSNIHRLSRLQPRTPTTQPSIHSSIHAIGNHQSLTSSNRHSTSSSESLSD